MRNYCVVRGDTVVQVSTTRASPQSHFLLLLLSQVLQEREDKALSRTRLAPSTCLSVNGILLAPSLLCVSLRTWGPEICEASPCHAPHQLSRQPAQRVLPPAPPLPWSVSFSFKRNQEIGLRGDETDQPISCQET